MNLNLLLNFLSRNRAVLPGVIALLTIFMLFLTLYPVDSYVPNTLWNYDKAGHLVLFGTWSFLLGLQRYLTIKQPPSYVLIFIVGTGFGITIEVMQYLLPFKREPEIWDVIFDGVGCLLAIWALRYIVNAHLHKSSVN